MTNQCELVHRAAPTSVVLHNITEVYVKWYAVVAEQTAAGHQGQQARLCPPSTVRPVISNIPECAVNASKHI